jgi:tRNA(Ile2) C34 agmatinyltransferase TiaS
MSDKICKRCGGSVQADHVGQICPLCGQQTTFDYRITPNPRHLEITGQKATLKHIALPRHLHPRNSRLSDLGLRSWLGRGDKCGLQTGTIARAPNTK